MPKNIAVCADGTGNANILGRGTNVFKLYELVDQNGHRQNPERIKASLTPLTSQVAIYHDGVGTEDFKWLRIFAGATGYGLSRNVKQLYGELCRAYTPGDKIFLFGFSRGAFTVRTLAGLISACGILNLFDGDNYKTNAQFQRGIDEAYDEYRRTYQTRLSRFVHGKRPPLDQKAKDVLRKRFSVDIPAFHNPDSKLIEFLGVWDTVDAVGLPVPSAEFVNRWIYAFKFPDSKLNSDVKRACHALALDEERESFAPLLWSEATTTSGQTIEQVWFAGVHSNVGGGYPRQGMSLVALEWMLKKAEKHDLRFIEPDRALYGLHADVDDKLYDSRGGLGIFYRWKPRDVQALCKAHGIQTPRVHRSAIERIARNTEGYAPGSLPPRIDIESTTLGAAAAEVEALIARHHQQDAPLGLMRREAGWLVFGAWSYWLFVWAVLIIVAFMVVSLVGEAARGADTWLAAARGLVETAASSRWIGLLLQTLRQHPWLGIALVVTLLLALWVEHHLDNRYSEFWHRIRYDLRNTLGLGRPGGTP